MPAEVGLTEPNAPTERGDDAAFGPFCRAVGLAASLSLALLGTAGCSRDYAGRYDATTDGEQKLDVATTIQPADTDASSNDPSGDQTVATATTPGDIAASDPNSAGTPIAPADMAGAVHAGSDHTMAPVGIDQPAVPTPAVSISITSVAAVDTTARLPGEIAGPGVSLTLEFSNNGDVPIDLASVIVDLVGADGVSATPSTTDSEPLEGSLPPAASASGAYVFTIDPSLRGDVIVRLSFSADAPTVLFAGSLASA